MRIKLVDNKSPGEVIPVTFDFSKLVTSIDSTVIEVTVKNGDDANPSLLLYSSAIVSDSIVSQIIQGGLNEVIYTIKCTITSGNMKYSEAMYLPVEELT